LPGRVVPLEQSPRQRLARRHIKPHGGEDGATGVVARDVKRTGDIVIVGTDTGSRGEQAKQVLLSAVVHSVERV
jgi:hypothetical protein